MRLSEFLERRAENLIQALRRLHRCRCEGQLPPTRLPKPLINLYDLTFAQLQRAGGSLPLSDAWLESAWERACGVAEDWAAPGLAVGESVSQPYRVDSLLPLTDLQQASFFAEMGLVGRHPVWLEVLNKALQAARFDFPVLLSGETGVGKEVVARAIHAHSRRAEASCVFVNCGAVPETLAATEFFGFRGGSFTGSDARDRKGWLEAAHRGTLILDEIAELPLETQPLLLRALQNGEAQKVGGGAVKVDFRLIAITNRSLEEEVDAGRFRRDLYYRIAVIPLRIPPLRERPTDVPLLAQHFLDKFRLNNPDLKPRGFSSEAIRALMAHLWQGNVRELQNVVARALVLGAESQIEARHLVFDLSKSAVAVDPVLMERLKTAAPGRVSIEALAGFLLERTAGFSSGDYVRRFGCSESTARRHLEGLLRAGLITASGAGKGRRYRI